MVDHSSLDSVCRPIEQATGLPNAHYIDSGKFDEERRAVLFANWSGIGFGKDIPAPGDVRPLEFLGMPLLLVRDHDGDVSVFQNTCRHRGMILVDKPTRLRNTLRCPYHSWCYSLKGELRATPHVGGAGCNTHPSIQPAELGLIRIRSHIWRDVVFVNIDGEAEPFEQVHEKLLQRWHLFEQPLHHGGASSSFSLGVRSNWKLAVENYCESYHLPWIHPELNRNSRLDDHYDIQVPGRFSGQGSRVYRQLRGQHGECFADFGNLSPPWHSAAEYVALYPNVLLGVHRDHAFAIVLEAVDTASTREHVELYYASEPSENDGLATLRETNARQWKTVFEEDIGVVEGMQRGRHGVLFDGGRFSPAMDSATHNFHRWVAECLLDSGTA